MGTATTQSATILPVGARVFTCWLEVLTPYSPGTTIEIGRTGDLDAFQLATDNVPQVADMYQRGQDTRINSTSTHVIATVSGAPVAGASTVIVFYADDVET